MSIELEVLVPPGEGDLVELIHALTWAKLRHSVGLEIALEKTRLDLEVSEKQFRALLQSSWRRIAGIARQGKIEVWGKPVYDRHFDGNSGWRGNSERQLNLEELRNCKFLSWPLDPKAGLRMPRVERHPDTYSGGFSRHTKQSAEEFDFVRVTVARAALMKEFTAPGSREVLRRSAAAGIRRAVKEAVESLEAATPEVRNSLSRTDVLSGLIHKHGLSIRHGGGSDKVWKHLITRFPVLGRSGPRRKPPTL